MTKRATKKVTTKAKKVPARKAATKKVTKASRFSGKKLFPTERAKKSNPRRPVAKLRNGQSHPAFGFVSLEIIRKQPGITYEDFLKAGGRRVDLAWDVNAGNAEAR